MGEIFRVGDKVRIRITPGCPQEFICHGSAPLNNERVGNVVQISNELKNGHCYCVGDLGIAGHPNARLWFAPFELQEALEV